MKYKLFNGSYVGGGLSGLRVELEGQKTKRDFISPLVDAMYASLGRYYFDLNQEREKFYFPRDTTPEDEVEYAVTYGDTAWKIYNDEMIHIFEWFVRVDDPHAPYDDVWLSASDFEKILKHYLYIMWQGVKEESYNVDNNKWFDTNDDKPCYHITDKDLTEIRKKFGDYPKGIEWLPRDF